MSNEATKGILLTVFFVAGVLFWLLVTLKVPEDSQSS